MDNDSFFDNSLLVSQLQQAVGITDAADFEAWLMQTPPVLRRQLRTLLTAVKASYTQFAQDALLHQCHRLSPSLSDPDQATQNAQELSALLQQLAQEREAALTQSHHNQARFQLIVDSTEDGVWDWNVEKNHVYFSPRWFGLLGYSAEALPMTLATRQQLMHPEDWEEVEPILQAHLQGRSVDYCVEVRMRNKNGEWRWIRERGKVVQRDGNEQPLRMVGTHTDVTLQRLQEQEMRDKLHFIEALMDIIPMPVYFNGLDGKYLGFNKAWEIFFGKSRSKWIGQDVHQLFDGARATQHAQLDQQLYAQGGVQTFETQVIGADGSVRDTLYSKAIFRKGDGTPAGILGTITDITERKRTERELQIAKDAAEAANHAKSDFLANMSHEIRTPMNGIIGMTALALDTPLDDTQREYLRMVKVSADALLTIINDILDFSKIEAGRLDIEDTPFDLRRTLEEIIAPLQLKAHRQGLRFLTTIDACVPTQVVGDPVRLRQILLNLMGNALKFTARGEIVVSVWVEASDAPSTQIHFAVRDTGVGIPAEKLDVIFESFAQGDSSTTRHYGGTGLGLTISRRLVELMKGRLWVESTVGHGSTFHVTLCFAVAQDQEVRALPRADTTESHQKVRALQVLLAEDNRINQTLVIRLLDKMGHRVEIAQTGIQAIEMYQRGDFDVILMDVQMPEMGGFEATQKIRDLEQLNQRHVPIIALTAHAMQGDEQKCLAAGMDGYLSKPLDRKKLQASLTRIAQQLPV